MAEIIASGTTTSASSDFTVTDGASATLFLKTTSGAAVPPGAQALVQIKSGSNYFTIGRLTDSEPIQVLRAAGTFRVQRQASTEAFGVDKE